jgi:hypothetical protein
MKSINMSQTSRRIGRSSEIVDCNNGAMFDETSAVMPLPGQQAREKDTHPFGL